MFLENQICILEGFLKEYATLKTGAKAAKHFALLSQE